MQQDLTRRFLGPWHVIVQLVVGQRASAASSLCLGELNWTLTSTYKQLQLPVTSRNGPQLTLFIEAFRVSAGEFVDNDFLTADTKTAAFEVEDFLLEFEVPLVESPAGSITANSLVNVPVMGAMRGGGLATVCNS
jgi:hypothetical protein